MTAKAIAAYRLSGSISDAARRKLEGTASVLPIFHAVRGELAAGVIGHPLANATVRKFRTVARKGAWNLESRGIKHQTQTTRKSKKGVA